MSDSQSYSDDEHDHRAIETTSHKRSHSGVSFAKNSKFHKSTKHPLPSSSTATHASLKRRSTSSKNHDREKDRSANHHEYDQRYSYEDDLDPFITPPSNNNKKKRSSHRRPIGITSRHEESSSRSRAPKPPPQVPYYDEDPDPDSDDDDEDEDVESDGNSHIDHGELDPDAPPVVRNHHHPSSASQQSQRALNRQRLLEAVSRDVSESSSSTSNSRSVVMSDEESMSISLGDDDSHSVDPHDIVRKSSGNKRSRSSASLSRSGKQPSKRRKPNRQQQQQRRSTNHDDDLEGGGGEAEEEEDKIIWKPTVPPEQEEIDSLGPLQPKEVCPGCRYAKPDCQSTSHLHWNKMFEMYRRTARFATIFELADAIQKYYNKHIRGDSKSSKYPLWTKRTIIEHFAVHITDSINFQDQLRKKIQSAILNIIETRLYETDGTTVRVTTNREVGSMLKMFTDLYFRTENFKPAKSVFSGNLTFAGKSDCIWAADPHESYFA